MIDDFKKFNANQVYFQGETYERNTINNKIEKLKDYLNKNSSSNSPFIYLFASNHLKTLIAFYSIINCNKVCVLIDPQIQNLELNELFVQCPPSVIIKIDTTTIDFTYNNEIEFAQTQEFKQKSDLKDIMLIVFSNAFDGHYKAAMVSSYNLYSLIKSTDERVDFERVCSLLPFSHLFGFTYGLLSPSFMGRPFLISDLSNFLTMEKIAIQIHQYKITHLLSVPVIFYMLSKIRNIKNYFSNVRTCISGGIKLSNEISEKFYMATGKYIQEGYGLTEASPACSLQALDEINIDTVGTPLSCCEITIRDNNGKKLGINTKGEIYIRGKSIIKGYYNNDLCSSDYFDGEWFKTGDIGKIDNNNHLHLLSLKKRMLNVAGKNVFPNEVERIILSHSNVKNVSIFGIKNPILGDIVNVNLSLKENQDQNQKEIKDWCKKNLSSYKVPAKWHFST